MSAPPSDPHAAQRIVDEGPPVESARAVVVAVHGRGASPDAILTVARQLALPDLAWVAPAAAGGTWYPYSFLAPMQQNEPGLSSGLRLLSTVVDDLAARGVPHRRIAVLGFSQGACLSLEFAARHARRYLAVIGFSGGLIGPPGTPRDYTGTFDGTPVFLGCSDIDSHIPLERVHETAAVLGRMGAEVDERIYPRMGHTIIDDELEAARVLLHRT